MAQAQGESVNQAGYQKADAETEEIVMTPSKRGKTTSIRIEKVRKTQVDQTKVAHTGGGQHSGLIINKQNADDAVATPPQLQLEFKCFLVDNKSGKHIPESRVLKFWFAEGTDYLEKVTGAYEFFKELVRPDDFPRDYVGFIKKIMKQTQYPRYHLMKKVEVDMEQLTDNEQPPTGPANQNYMAASGIHQEDTRPKEVQVQEQVLHTLESAYPNILPLEELAKFTNADEAQIQEQLQVLKGRNLIRELEPGKWVRKVLDEKTEVKVVKAMPQQAGSEKPTIAIITSKYYEKLAVDAMMENKTTYVKFKSEGESNVYTIGNIGSHKVVSTKIPQLGRQRAAQIASGNTTTRLLGTFSDIEHVLLVGVAGGVPHFTDFYKHVRLGDVIMATPNNNGFLYVFCDRIDTDEEKGTLNYKLKSWSPRDPILLQAYEKLTADYQSDPSLAIWETYITDGQRDLQGQEVDFTRPSQDTDRLYMNIGGNDVIEVGHPPVPEDIKDSYREDITKIRSGAIGAGRPVIEEDKYRQDFALRHNCVSFDTEFDQVLESIVGNRKDSFAFVRGISDYLDGTKNVNWQPYSALAAAAFMKALVEALPPPGYSN